MQSKFSELFRHFFIYGFGSIVQSLTSFILLPVITKYLNPTDYGIYIIINMIGLIAGTVFYFGITSALPRSYFDYDSEQDRNSVLSTALYLILFGATAQTVLGLFFGDKLSVYFFNTVQYSQILKVMIFASALAFINTFFQTYFRLLNRSLIVVAQGLIASLINFAVAIILFKTTTLNIYIPVISFLLSQSVIFFYSLYLNQKKLQLNFNKKEAVLMLKFGGPTIVVSFTMMAFEWSDRFFLNKYLTLAEVGIYSFAYKFGGLINPILIAPFTQIWNPLMMKYKDSHDIEPLTSKVFTFYFAIGSLFCLIACNSLDELILLFVKNSEYHKGIYIIPVVMASFLLYGTSNISSAGFLYQRKISEISTICLIFALTSILSSYLLIPMMGFSGAALSTFIIYVLLGFALLIRSRNYFKFKIEVRKISLFILINFGAVFLIQWLKFDSLAFRLITKAVLVILNLLLTLFVLLESQTFEILKNPKIVFSFLKNEQPGALSHDS